MKCSSITIDGVSTRYFSAGSGDTTLLLLHGIGMGGDSYLRNIPALGERFHVIAPDMLGHGATKLPPLNGVPPALAMARHLLGLLRTLDIDTCVAAGSSFGGLVAALLHLEAPTLVRKLLLAGSGSTCNPVDVQSRTLRASMDNALGAMREASTNVLRRRLRNIVYDDSGVDDALILSQLTTYAQPAVAQAYEQIILATIDAGHDPSGRTSHRLHELRLPILMVAGCEDVRAPIELQEQYVQRFPDARLLKYERCGHFPFLEHPERFNADLTDFALTP
ncbi:MAG: alpha/beta hydrolase [Burkholderiales bacterium]|nr:MAG: alpha/beta hydrolase [Burkholderiales bacterium]